MGIFGAMDIESAEESLWPKNDTYRCVLTDAVVAPSKKTADLPEGEKEYFWVLTYEIQEGRYKSTDLYERKRVFPNMDPENPTPEEEKAATYIKRRLNSLGIPESRHNSVTNDDLKGIECAVTVKENSNSDFPPNVTRVELLQATGLGNAQPDSSGMSVFKGM
jgi:hypothetical protein